MNKRLSLPQLVVSLTLLLLPLLACCRANPQPGTGIPVSAPWCWTATGEGTSDRFGFAVGAAGDVDGDGYGDGYDDVITGAPNHDGYTGRVYVYAGGAAGLNATPSFILDGQEPNSWYGHAMGTAGDLDADGHVEVIIGAYGYGDWAGRVYVPCTLGDGQVTMP